MHNYQLNEGLRPLDLSEMVYSVFDIDTHRSKMGEDRDVCVLSFQVKDRSPAKDLMEFIEKGYEFVLDADVSSGENENGEYSVFVEIPRTQSIAENIRELMYGVKRLTGLENFKFRYHKNPKIFEVKEETLITTIPPTPEDYDSMMLKEQTNEVRQFFNRTLMDDLTISGDIITFHKPFNNKISLRWLNANEPYAIVEGAPAVDDATTAEIFWLTKVLGDYNIMKYDDKLVFVNGDKTMLLQRI